MMPNKTQKVIELVPPDGGWGWMVLLGVAVNNIFNVSVLSVFGLLYGDAILDMGHGTQGAALVLNTVYFVAIFGGPIAGAMVKITSPRMVAVTGACICSISIFCTGFSTHLWHLVITYGLLLGLGLDLVIVSSFVAVNSYFKLKKSRAVGLALVGTSVGQTLLPHLVTYLLENYGFRNACIILSCMSLLGVIGCTLIQPVELHMKKIESEVVIEAPKQTLDDIQNVIEDNRIPQTNDDDQENDSHTVIEDAANESSIHIKMTHAKIDQPETSVPNSVQKRFASDPQTPRDKPEPEPQGLYGLAADTVINPVLCKKRKILRKLDDLFGVTLLRNIRFINILMGIALTITSIQNFTMLFPFFLEKKISLNKQQTANCMSIIAFADLAGRFILPTVVDKYKINPRWAFIMTCVLLIITRQILAYQTNLEVILAISGLYGFGRSMVMVERNIIISENCKQEEVPAAVGLDKLWTGLVSLPLGYFLGWIRDYTDSYVVSLSAQNALLVILLLTWIPDLIYLNFKKNKNRNKILNKHNC